MTTASEIEQLAMDVFDNKESYKDGDFITILNMLKESYMKVKGLSGEYKNEKDSEVDSDSESDDEYFLQTHTYGANDEENGCYTDSASPLAFRSY